jgi:hypothetical protein
MDEYQGIITIKDKKVYEVNGKIIDLNDIPYRILLAIILNALHEEGIKAEVTFWSTSSELTGRVSNDLPDNGEISKDR